MAIITAEEKELRRKINSYTAPEELKGMARFLGQLLAEDYFKKTGDPDPTTGNGHSLSYELESEISRGVWKHISDVTGYCRERDGECTDPKGHGRK